MQQQPGPFHMAQKVMAEAGAVRGAFNQSGNIGKDNVLSVPADNAEVGRQRRKMIVSAPSAAFAPLF